MEAYSVGVPLKPRDSLGSDNDGDLEETLTRLHKNFQLKTDTMKLCTEEVVKICSESLTASNVRHSPVTHRVKSWDSAKGSIRRRHQERTMRTELYNIVMGEGRKWLDYCHETGLEPHEDEMEPPQTPDQMLSALHDFGGVRISLYFPGDVERVAAILDARFKVIRTSNKAQGSGANHVRRLQERIGHFQNSTPNAREVNNTSAISPKDHKQLKRTFTGYKATHFVVTFLDTDIQEDQRSHWKNIQIEIQVGTLVMHVWSEIEHDMIYKPPELQGEKVSDDEERVLDLINGIVLTGEAALRQLEASTSKRLNQRVGNEEAMASNYYELAVWIEKHCEAEGISLESGEWRLLSQLFSVLSATGEHRHSYVKRLIDETRVSPKASRQTLPILMLQAFCKRATDAKDPVPSYDKDVMARNARFWALRLVHSLNLAIYLGVGQEFLDLSRSCSSRPSITSFLDMVHPSHSRHGNIETIHTIIEYCQSIVNPETGDGRVGGLLRVALDLPKADTVVGTTEFDGHRRILIPGIITRLLPDNLSRLMGDNTDDNLDTLADEDEFYRVFDLINTWLTHKRADIDDKSFIWDLAKTSATGDYKGPVTNRFFVPRTTSQGTPQDQSVHGWQIIHHTMKLHVVKLAMYKEPQTVQTTRSTEKSNVFNTSPGLSMGLAYRLFPEKQWDDVRKFWEVAEKLRHFKKTKHVKFEVGPQMNRDLMVTTRRRVPSYYECGPIQKPRRQPSVARTPPPPLPPSLNDLVSMYPPQSKPSYADVAARKKKGNESPPVRLKRRSAAI